MKNLFLLVLLFIAVTIHSCSVVQVMEAGPTSNYVSTDGQYYYFENDTLKIVYYFWGAQGHMSMVVKNKLNIPIYIDWKKSSCIMENRTAPYYSDMEQSDFSAHSNSVGVKWNNSISSSHSSTTGSGVTVKSERITFIPPNSNVERTFGKLTDYGFVTVEKNSGKEVTVNGKKGKRYIMPTNFMPFRNYLTYSGTENFDKAQIIDNSFSVTSVTVIKGHDLGKMNKSEGTFVYRFSDPKSYHTQMYKEHEIYK